MGRTVIRLNIRVDRRRSGFQIVHFLLFQGENRRTEGNETDEEEKDRRGNDRFVTAR